MVKTGQAITGRAFLFALIGIGFEVGEGADLARLAVLGTTVGFAHNAFRICTTVWCVFLWSACFAFHRLLQRSPRSTPRRIRYFITALDDE